MNFNPFPNLETTRLNLRKLNINDENEIFFLRSDEQILKYLDIPKAKTINDAREYIDKINRGIANNEWIMWAITLKDNPKLIGTICFWKISSEKNKAEIGIVLHPDNQGKGLAQEVTKAVIDYGFNKMGLQIIEGELSPNNLSCIKLLKRNGFSKDQKFKENPNTVMYKLLR